MSNIKCLNYDECCTIWAQHNQFLFKYFSFSKAVSNAFWILDEKMQFLSLIIVLLWLNENQLSHICSIMFRNNWVLNFCRKVWAAIRFKWRFCFYVKSTTVWKIKQMIMRNGYPKKVCFLIILNLHKKKLLKSSFNYLVHYLMSI